MLQFNPREELFRTQRAKCRDSQTIKKSQLWCFSALITSVPVTFLNHLEISMCPYRTDKLVQDLHKKSQEFLLPNLYKENYFIFIRCIHTDKQTNCRAFSSCTVVIQPTPSFEILPLLEFLWGSQIGCLSKIYQYTNAKLRKPTCIGNFTFNMSLS